MKRSLSVLCLGVAIALPGGSAVAVGATPVTQSKSSASDPYDGPGVLVSPEEMLTRQAEDLRREYPQYSLDQAKTAIKDTVEFALATSKARDEFPEEYSYSRSIYEASGFRGQVHVKGRGSEKLKSLMANLSATAEVVGDAPWTKAETRRISAIVIDDLARKPGIGDVTVRPDVATASVEILAGVEPGSDPSLALKSKDESKARVDKKLKDTGLPITDLKYTVDPKYKSQPAVLSGGTTFSELGATASNPNPKGICTSAFTVTNRTNGRVGLLTAEHCGTRLWYEGRVQMTRVAAADPSVTTDASFVYNSNEGVRPYFIFDRSSTGVVQTTTVRSVAEFPVDTLVYTYGQTTADQRSSRIEKHDIDKYYRNVDRTYYNLTETVSDIVTYGDSGGPVYVGNTATGIISGFDEGVVWDATWYAPIDDATRRTNTRVNLY